MSNTFALFFFMRQVLKIVGVIILAILVFLALYAVAAFGLGAIAVNRKNVAQRGIPLYLSSNGAHVDLVLPVRNALCDWSADFPTENTKGRNANLQWIAIGWGDKGFYLNTPTWAELKFSTAFKAATALSSSAVHATYMAQPVPGENCRLLYATEAQYKALIAHIRQALDLDANGKPILIQTNAQYGADDAFYEAKGAYHAFKTCNTWTNSTLKAAGMKACVWTPMAKAILNKYPLDGGAMQ